VHLDLNPFQGWIDVLQRHVPLLPLSQWDQVKSQRTTGYIEGEMQELIFEYFFQLAVPDVVDTCTAITRYADRMATFAEDRMNERGDYRGLNLIITY